MSNQQPHPYDAVLGGQNQAPIDAAVLGGIAGVRQKLASDNEAVKKEGILQALNYGEKGIEALFGVLERERNLNIQWLAHQTLAKQGDPGINAKLKHYFGWYEYESVTVNRRGEIIKRTPGGATYYREYLGNGAYLDMVYIAGGSFLMGSPSSEKKSDWSKGKEEPQHRVTVPEMWMGKYQVTQAQ
jgi:formylglycine-generating enzyme required for sulfatase activity